MRTRYASHRKWGFLSAFFICHLLSAPFLYAADVASVEAESFLKGVISGYCFNDANRNGTRDESEEGLAGIKVSLARKFLLIFPVPFGTAETDAEGKYEFSDLRTGMYTIEVSVAEGSQCTSTNPVQKWLGIFRKTFSCDFGIFQGQLPPPAVSVQITASPMKISAGASATLSWTSENAISASIDQGIGEVAAKGSLEVFPEQTTTYTISAEGEDGSTAQASVTITVDSEIPPPPEASTSTTSSSAGGGGGSGGGGGGVGGSSATTSITSLQSSSSTTTIETTAVTLASFYAQPGNAGVTLVWETGDETNNFGFNIYRAESENGDYVKINETIIKSQAYSGSGTKYAFVDRNVKNRTTYYYKLEDIDVHGVSTFHGPVSATPRLL